MTHSPHEFAITYVGGPTAVLSIDGVRFITDPTFDPAGGDYASGVISLHKTAGPALLPAQLGPFDVALVSHDQHPDNLDHSDGWTHFTQSQEDLAKAFQALGLADRLRPVRGGEVIRFG